MTLTIWRGPDAALKLASHNDGLDQAGTSWLPSPPELDGQRTVAEQAVAVASAHGLKEPPELADFVVDLLDAEALLDKPSWHFSRGEQQMAGLIVAFSRPFERVVLVDPTAGLDARRAAALADFLVDLALDIDVDIVSDAEIFASF